MLALLATRLAECAVAAAGLLYSDRVAPRNDPMSALALQILAALRAAPPEHGTSILTDHEAGQPLEWNARNGVIQRKGRARGVPTPISDVLVPLLAAASNGPG